MPTRETKHTAWRIQRILTRTFVDFGNPGSPIATRTRDQDRAEVPCDAAAIIVETEGVRSHHCCELKGFYWIVGRSACRDGSQDAFNPLGLRPDSCQRPELRSSFPRRGHTSATEPGP